MTDVVDVCRFKVRILVCGGRDYLGFGAVYDTLRIIMQELELAPKDVLIIVGGARGADTYGEEWARDMGIACKVEYADWGRYGVSAGCVRNQKMLDEYAPHIVVSAPGGRGTADMRRRAASEFAEIIDIPA
jgi:hypothetical protein